MNADIFAEWLKQQGHLVIRTPSSYWFDQGPRVFQAFPYHWVIEPPEEELSQLLVSSRFFGLRYSTPMEAPYGRVSYHAVYEQESYDINNLGKRTRATVRRSLKKCQVEQIPFTLLADQGWELYQDTLARQGRGMDIEKKTWERRCLAAGDLAGFEAWGAFVGERLAASVITFQMEDWAYMLYQQCHRNFLKERVNNALSYFVSKELLSCSKTHFIFYGLHSLDAPDSVDEFKFLMGYRAKAVKQRVVFHPTLKPLMNSAMHNILSLVQKLIPTQPSLSKAEGMLRFYLEGKRPMEAQTLPEGLNNKKRNNLID